MSTTAAMTGKAPMPTPASDRGTQYFDADEGSKDHLVHAGSGPLGSTDTVMPTGTGAGAGNNMQPTRNESGYTADNSDVGDGLAGGPQKDTFAYPNRQPNADAGTGVGAGATVARNNTTSTTNGRHERVGSGGAGTGRGVAFSDNGYGNGNGYGDRKSMDYAYGAGDDVSGGQLGQRTTSPERAGSMRSTTTSDARRQRASGTFAGGAALNSPEASPEADAVQHQRQVSAESALPEKVKTKINKAELKDAKRLSKVIKAEGKVQKSTLSSALDELTSLQKMQKQAASDEAKARKAHVKAARTAQKLQAVYLEAKARWEQAEADLKARDEQLDASRAHAQSVTQQLADTARECEELRRSKVVDDREREAKLSELATIGKKQK